MKGKWAQGIEPRHFTWIVKGRLAVCERPGGYGPNHRRVRRQEEIIWLREQQFDYVVSLIPAPHNLHNYIELRMPYRHRPFVGNEDLEGLRSLYVELHSHMQAGRRVAVHRDELGDHVVGLMAGYLLWSGLVDTPPQVVSVIEQLTQRQLGPLGRRVVSATPSVAPPSAGDRDVAIERLADTSVEAASGSGLTVGTDQGTDVGTNEGTDREAEDA
jgi:hypothetical protein